MHGQSRTKWRWPTHHLLDRQYSAGSEQYGWGFFRRRSVLAWRPLPAEEITGETNTSYPTANAYAASWFTTEAQNKTKNASERLMERSALRMCGRETFHLPLGPNLCQLRGPSQKWWLGPHPSLRQPPFGGCTSRAALTTLLLGCRSRSTCRSTTNTRS